MAENSVPVKGEMETVALCGKRGGSEGGGGQGTHHMFVCMRKLAKCEENESYKTHVMEKGLLGGLSGFSVEIQRKGEKRRPDPKKVGRGSGEG